MINGVICSEWIPQGSVFHDHTKREHAFHQATPSRLNESYKDTMYKQQYQAIGAIISWSPKLCTGEVRF